MNKIYKNALALSLLFLVSCGSANQEKPLAYDESGYPLLSEGSLHEVSVKYGNRAFVNQDKTTEYKIIVDSSVKGASEAASFIISHVYNATGALLESIDIADFEDSVSRSDKYIIIGSSDLLADANKELPSFEVLGRAGYYISSYGNSVFLMARRYSGYQMGSLSFLRQTVGYDMIVEDTVVYERDGSIMPDMEIKERPDFDCANPTNNMTATTKYGMGYATSYAYITPVCENPKDYGASFHNVFNYISPVVHTDSSNMDEYHPEWFSESGEQLCYTAHGDSESLDLMIDTAFESVKRSIANCGDNDILNFTDNDVGNCCTCSSCQAAINKDGSISGSIIRFVNKLDDKMQAYLEKEAEENHTEKREIHLNFFAYLSSINPPSVSVEADPSLKLNEDIYVLIAPLHANYTKTFYDEENASYADNIKAWGNYASHITAWVYETDYHHYLYPYNTYSTMMVNYRFLKANGASIIYNEGQRYNQNVTCFGKLKEYLDSKAMFDVNASYSDCVDKFFANYFKDASSIMRQYYEEMISWETYLESKPETYGLGGGVYQEIGSKAEYWPKQMLVNWLSQMDEAYKTIEKYQTSDPSLYKTLKKHILIESMFPRFALCNLHGSSYSPNELLQMRRNFKKDAESIGMVEHMEHYYLESVYSSWGI